MGTMLPRRSSNQQAGVQFKYAVGEKVFAMSNGNLYYRGKVKRVKAEEAGLKIKKKVFIHFKGFKGEEWVDESLVLQKHELEPLLRARLVEVAPAGQAPSSEDEDLNSLLTFQDATKPRRKKSADSDDANANGPPPQPKKSHKKQSRPQNVGGGAVGGGGVGGGGDGKGGGVETNGEGVGGRKSAKVVLKREETTTEDGEDGLADSESEESGEEEVVNGRRKQGVYKRRRIDYTTTEGEESEGEEEGEGEGEESEEDSTAESPPPPPKKSHKKQPKKAKQGNGNVKKTHKEKVVEEEGEEETQMERAAVQAYGPMDIQVPKEGTVQRFDFGPWAVIHRRQPITCKGPCQVWKVSRAATQERIIFDDHQVLSLNDTTYLVHFKATDDTPCLLQITDEKLCANDKEGMKDA